jgi:hypothetical protein
MKTLIYQVNIPFEGHSKLYELCIDSAKRYAERIGADHRVLTEQVFKIPVDMTRTNRNKHGLISLAGNTLPIMEKSVALTHFDEYDKILILDADIYVRDTSPNIFEEINDHHFGGVLERDLPLTMSHRNKIIGYSRDMFKKSPCDTVDWRWNADGAEFMNMGMMLFDKSFMDLLEGDSPREFLMRDEFADFRDGVGLFRYSTDQVLYNYFMKKSKAKVKQMSWKWNTLYRGAEDRYISQAHFVHFFLKSQIRNNGEDLGMVKGILGI